MFIKLIPLHNPHETHYFLNAHCVLVSGADLICVLDSESCKRFFTLDDYSVEIVSQASAPDFD